MVMRYAVLVGAAAATIFGAINLSANGSNMLLVDAGQGGPSADLPAWVLGMVGAVMVLSCLRSVRSEERRVGKESRSRWSPYH